MNSWNGLDFFIFLIFAANVVLGMVRGATREIISMICLSVSLIFSIKFTIPLTNFFNASPLMSSVISSPNIQAFMQAIGAGSLTSTLLYQLFYSISLLICFSFPYSICEGALAKVGIVEMYTFPFVWWDRKIGGALGCVRGYVLTLITLSILSLHLFAGARNPTIVTDSFFVHLFQGATQTFDSLISAQKPAQYEEIYKMRNLYKANEVLQKMGTELMPEGSLPLLNSGQEKLQKKEQRQQRAPQQQPSQQPQQSQQP